MTRIGALASKVTLDTSELKEGLVLTRRELRQAAAIKDDLGGPLGKYQQAVAGLNKLRAGGALGEKEYAAALRAVKEELDPATIAMRQQAQALETLKAKYSGLIGPADRIAKSQQDIAKLRSGGAISAAEHAAANQRLAEQRRQERTAARAPFESMLVGEAGMMRGKFSELDRLRKSGAISTAEHARAQMALRTEYAAGIPVLGRYAGLLNPMTAGFMAATAAAGAMAGAIGTAGAVVAARISAIDDMADSAERLGVSASSLSRLRGAAFLGDVDPGTVDSALQKMLVTLGKGGEQFEKLGLDVDKLREKRADQVFADVAAAISELPSKAERLAVISQIFGKGNVEIVGLIENFRNLDAAATASGAVVGDELAARVQRAVDAIKRMKQSSEGLSNQLTSAALPAVEGIAKALASFATDAEHRRDTFASLVGIFSLSPAAMMLAGNLPADSMAGGAVAGGAAGDAADLAASLEDVVENVDKGKQPLADFLQGLRDEVQMLDAAKSEEAAFRAARMGGDTAAQNEAAALTEQLETRRKQLETEKELASERKRMADEATSEAKKRVDEETALRESLRTPQEKIEADFLRNAELLGGDDKAKGILAKRAARDLFGRLGGDAPFGAPSGAVKGSAESRMITEGAKHQAAQVTLLQKIERHFAELKEQGLVEVEAIDAGI